MHTVAVVTISDGVNRGTREDVGGTLLRSSLEAAGYPVLEHLTVPDERSLIEALLRRLADDTLVSAIFTTGGTGLGPRDVTPEATLQVIDKSVPGMAEAIRAAGLLHTPYAMTSRQVVGIRGQTLIVTLPGSPKAVQEGIDVVLPVLTHVLQLLAGHTEHEGDGLRPRGD